MKLLEHGHTNTILLCTVVRSYENYEKLLLPGCLQLYFLFSDSSFTLITLIRAMKMITLQDSSDIDLS